VRRDTWSSSISYPSSISPIQHHVFLLRPSSCLERLQRVAFSGTNSEATSFRPFALSVAAQLAGFSQWNKANIILGQTLLPILRQQVLWNVLQMGLLSRRSQFAIVTEVVDF
jgi:hypothetical protein